MGITVFTPTYNRKNMLERAYKSLLCQEYKDFEWIIIDDGSTDETKELVEKFINEKKITVRYYYQENKGKYIAHNLGVMYAAYDIFLTLDSDDYLLPDALKNIDKIWKEKNIESQKKCAGILAPFDETRTTDINVTRSTIFDLYRKHNFKGEATIVWKTNIISRFPMPRIENDRFLSEGIYLQRIDRFYYYECINCRLEHREYYTDGLTASLKSITDKNWKAYLYELKNNAVYSQYFWYRSNNYLMYTILLNEKGISDLYPEMVTEKFVVLITKIRLFYRKITRKSNRDIFG